MKKNSLLIWLTAMLFLISSGNIFAKEIMPRIFGSGHVIKSSQSLPAFDKISAHGIDHITILKSDKGQNSLIIETDDNLMPYIHYNVKDGVLNFYYKDIKPTKLRFYILVSGLKEIKASGASELRTGDSLTGDSFVVKASGASQIRLNTNFKNINLEASGAADVSLTGTCQTLIASLSGAADLKAVKIKMDSAYVKASGAATARVNVSKYLNKNVSGVADVKLATSENYEPEVKDMSKRLNDYVNFKVDRFRFPQDTTRINIGSMRFEVVDGDSTKINVGNHTLVVTPHGDVRWKRNYRYEHFKGHWGGVDFGMNGYVNKSNNANFGPAYNYLSLQYEKSFNVNLNLYQQNIALNKAKTIGLITGAGLSFNDYRFSNPVYLDATQNSLTGYYIVNASVKKTKLSAYYADIPLILEFQSNNVDRSRRFFFGFGVIGNVRLRSHTKIYFNEANKVYSLEDPATGNLVADNYRTPDRENRNIVKNVNSFYLNPFKVDATVRLGFRVISLYATYALTPMFQAGRGPDLRQWTAGITLVKW
ncbi:MAG: DUF2807 domain-containing protein [Bacteroidales bacterium]|nr:DUF2807 domain-containing protein [Bacteroidales bacterium]